MKLLIFIFTILMSCTACNSNGQNHDSKDSPDLHDSDKDTETGRVWDACNSGSQKTDNDAVPDTDKAPDTKKLTLSKIDTIKN